MLVPWDSFSLVHPSRRRRSSAHSSAELKDHHPSALAPFFLSQTSITALLCRSAQLGPRATGSVHLIPAKGRKAAHRSRDTYKTALLRHSIQRDASSAKKLWFMIWFFPGHKITKWFIWSEKNQHSPTIFHSGVISYWFYQFPVSTIKSISRWFLQHQDFEASFSVTKVTTAFENEPNTLLL